MTFYAALAKVLTMQVFTLEQQKYFISGLKNRDERVFNEFYHYTKPVIKSFLSQKFPHRIQADIDDICQEFFIKVWGRIDSFNEDSKLITWLYRIAINLTIDKFSRNKHIINCESLDARLEKGEDFQSIKCLENNEQIVNKIAELKNCLGKRHLAVFNVVFEQGKQFKEAAEILKVPFGTVLSRSYYLRRKLKEKLA